MNKATRIGLFIFGALLTLTLFKGCGQYERKDPKTVVYREKVSETDSTEIWRNVKYELVSVEQDTVRKVTKPRNTLEIAPPKPIPMPEDRIDLNDYLGTPDDGTDWNYTEISEEEQKYLDDLGIYWDNNKGYWRQRK
jgi:hypothetical protein